MKTANRPSVQAVVRLSPKYAGRFSHRFWDAVGSVKGPRCWAKAYAMGCRLQELEAEVLKYVHDHQPNVTEQARAGSASPGSSGSAIP